MGNEEIRTLAVRLEKQSLLTNKELLEGEAHTKSTRSKKKIRSTSELAGRVQAILRKYKLSGIISWNVATYSKNKGTYYRLRFFVNKAKLEENEACDGAFPLLSTNRKMSTRDVLLAYKRQGLMESRNHEFKNLQNALPTYFKNIVRTETMVFLHFVAQVIYAVIEREISRKLKERGLSGLRVYPERRLTSTPTTLQVIRLFDNIFKYRVKVPNQQSIADKSELNQEQREVLGLLSISEQEFWNPLIKLVA